MDEGAVWADVYIEPSPPREHKAVKKFCALSVNQRLKNILKNSVNQCESVKSVVKHILSLCSLCALWQGNFQLVLPKSHSYHLSMLAAVLAEIWKIFRSGFSFEDEVVGFPTRRLFFCVIEHTDAGRD